jgi:hypothetical protein
MIPSMRKNRIITNRVLLEHMQAMRHAIEMRMDRMEKRIDRLDGNVRLIFIQISNIDERLDEIELEELPRRVTALERKSGSRK